MLDQRVRKHAIALDNMLAWQQAIVRTFMKHHQHVLPWCKPTQRWFDESHACKALHIPPLYYGNPSARPFLRGASVYNGALLSAREGPWRVISSPARLHGL